MISAAERRRIAEIPGWFSEAEGYRLFDLAASVPPELAIVEVGSYAGKSTCWLAAGARGHVTCVDPWDTEKLDYTDYSSVALFGEFVRATIPYRAKVTALRATSLEVARIWVDPIGLLFVDAVHTYEAVREDFLAWRPKMASGGWMAFHDYGDYYPGVGKALDEVTRDLEPTVVEQLWIARVP